MLNLSLNYVSLVSVPVIAESNISGRANVSTSDATITAQVRASGFRLASMSKANKRSIRLYIDPKDLTRAEGDYYQISDADLYKYSSAIFGDGVTVESFITQYTKFLFPVVSHKKVPVHKVQSTSFAQQYMARGEMEISPDSVYVYGETSRLENIEMIRTRPINLHDLRVTAQGRVKLDAPIGVRLSEEDVVYTLEVARYVELSETVEVKHKNVPDNINFEVLPSSVDVVFRCVFPVGVHPSKRASFYVDYRDYAKSITGKCVVKSENMPASVISYRIEPEVVDCMVNVR